MTKDSFYHKKHLVYTFSMLFIHPLIVSLSTSPCFLLASALLSDFVRSQSYFIIIPSLVFRLQHFGNSFFFFFLPRICMQDKPSPFWCSGLSRNKYVNFKLQIGRFQQQCSQMCFHHGNSMHGQSLLSFPSDKFGVVCNCFKEPSLHCQQLKVLHF